MIVAARTQGTRTSVGAASLDRRLCTWQWTTVAGQGSSSSQAHRGYSSSAASPDGRLCTVGGTVEAGRTRRRLGPGGSFQSAGAGGGPKQQGGSRRHASQQLSDLATPCGPISVARMWSHTVVRLQALRHMRSSRPRRSVVLWVGVGVLSDVGSSSSVYSFRVVSEWFAAASHIHCSSPWAACLCPTQVYGTVQWSTGQCRQIQAHVLRGPGCAFTWHVWVHACHAESYCSACQQSCVSFAGIRPPGGLGKGGRVSFTISQTALSD
jgi:hypothetical protein